MWKQIVIVFMVTCILVDCDYSPIKLAYEVFEPIGGADESLPPIIFMHGMGSTKEYWFEVPQIVADQTKRRVFNLDARNHGDSEYTEPYNFDMNAEDLLHFMDSKVMDKALLIGHSMGGTAVIRMALLHPDRVEMAFVEESYTKIPPKELLERFVKCLEALAEVVLLIPTDLNQTDAQAFVMENLFSKVDMINAAMGVSKRSTSSRRLLALRRGDDGRWAQKCNARELLNIMTADEPPISESEGLYEGPAYFIYGTESTLQVGNEEDHIKQFFPNAEFIPIEGVNHEVRLNVPEEFTCEVVKRITGGDCNY